MFYVYSHIRLDTNQPFYIGKGLKYRSHSTKGRNKHWNNIVSKCGYRIEIISSNLTNEEACRKEIALILKYGRQDIKTGILVNMTAGGEGNVGRIFKNNEISINKMRQTKRNAVKSICVENLETKVIVKFESQRQCAIEYFENKNAQTKISECLSNKRKTYKKHKFNYDHSIIQQGEALSDIQ